MFLKKGLLTITLLAAMSLGIAQSTAKADLVDTAVAAGSFKTLATLVGEAGLVDTLKSAGPFTVFAPNDAAFARVPKPAVDALLADKELLKEVLLYHVVPGKVMAKDLRRGHVKMANGTNARVRLGRKGEAKIDQAVVLATDIQASNGVIHVINNVILPPKAVKALQDAGIL
ncbi:MAG: fasciclin domain-containing protein [Fimbriimonadaceae bacterium]|nr:fasciclin domain-containing protein [Fimbriimonadaceae bacterium]